MTTSHPLQRYLARGWSVLPLLPGQKRPDPTLLPRLWDEVAGTTLPTWKPFQHRPATAAEVTGWLAQQPALNVGIVTGTVSGLVVLDLDGTSALRDALRRGLPHTPTAATGKGLHLYLAHPGGPVSNHTNLLDGVPGYDLRADGGYVGAPPSRHPSGGHYRWLVSPDDAPLAPLPGWLLARVRPDATRRVREPAAPPLPRTRVQDLDERAAARLHAYVARAAEEELALLRATVEGSRNHQLNRTAFCLGQWVGAGLLEQAAVEELLAATARRIGLPRGEARRTIASGLRAGIAQPRPLPDFAAAQ